MKKHTGTTPEIPILFEDDYLLVIDKPQNVLSQKDHTGDPDVLTLCKEYLNENSVQSGTPFLGLIHRLDRPVSGIMLLAKTSEIASGLSAQQRNRLIQKTYAAVVWGSTPASGMLTHYLFKERSRNIVRVVSSNHREGKKAMLSFIKVREEEGKTLLSVHLQTGRPHQIRVQLAEENFPIWGDYKYGKQNKPDGRPIALRATELKFYHPITQEELHFEVDFPDTEPWCIFNN